MPNENSKPQEVALYRHYIEFDIKELKKYHSCQKSLFKRTKNGKSFREHNVFAPNTEKERIDIRYSVWDNLPEINTIINNEDVLYVISVSWWSQSSRKELSENLKNQIDALIQEKIDYLNLKVQRLKNLQALKNEF